MKKLLSITAVLAALALCLSSCSSTKLNIPVSEAAPVAIVSVHGNTSVPWYVRESDRKDEEDGVINDGALSTLVNKNFRGNNPELLTIEERIDTSAKILAETFKDYGMEVIPVEKVYETPVFNDSTFNFLTDMDGGVCAQGYDSVTATNKNRNKEICSYTGAKTTCFVEFEFRKFKDEYSFTENHVKAHVVMNVYMSDAEGKKLVNKSFTALSDDYVVMGIRNYPKDKLVALFPQAVKKACNELMIYLTGIEPEVAKTMENESALNELSDEQLSQAVQIKLPAKKSESADTTETTETTEEDSLITDEPEVIEE